MDYDLFNAVLAMDSYNRGYGASIFLSDDTGTKIGNVTISAAISDDDVDARNISFYAIAYDVGGAGTIISFRGTDDPFGGDVYHGWSLATGNIASQQGQMAHMSAA